MEKKKQPYNNDLLPGFYERKQLSNTVFDHMERLDNLGLEFLDDSVFLKKFKAGLQTFEAKLIWAAPKSYFVDRDFIVKDLSDSLLENASVDDKFDIIVKHKLPLVGQCKKRVVYWELLLRWYWLISKKLVKNSGVLPDSDDMDLAGVGIFDA